MRDPDRHRMHSDEGLEGLRSMLKPLGTPSYSKKEVGTRSMEFLNWQDRQEGEASPK